jgi:hypothetical protein
MTRIFLQGLDTEVERACTFSPNAPNYEFNTLCS